MIDNNVNMKVNQVLDLLEQNNAEEDSIQIIKSILTEVNTERARINEEIRKRKREMSKNEPPNKKARKD